MRVISTSRATRKSGPRSCATSSSAFAPKPVVPLHAGSLLAAISTAPYQRRMKSSDCSRVSGRTASSRNPSPRCAPSVYPANRQVTTGTHVSKVRTALSIHFDTAARSTEFATSSSPSKSSSSRPRVRSRRPRSTGASGWSSTSTCSTKACSPPDAARSRRSGRNTGSVPASSPSVSGPSRRHASSKRRSCVVLPEPGSPSSTRPWRPRRFASRNASTSAMLSTAPPRPSCSSACAALSGSSEGSSAGSSAPSRVPVTPVTMAWSGTNRSSRLMGTRSGVLNPASLIVACSSSARTRYATIASSSFGRLRVLPCVPLACSSFHV